MKKFLLILLVLVLFIFGIFYMLFFTKSGNGIISQYIENSFNEKQNDFKLKFDTFIIDTNNINLVANINDSSKVKIDGKINSLFDLKAEFIYKIDIKDLAKKGTHNPVLKLRSQFGFGISNNFNTDFDFLQDFD